VSVDGHGLEINSIPGDKLSTINVTTAPTARPRILEDHGDRIFFFSIMNNFNG
jgi:hypothetical protein